MDELDFSGHARQMMEERNISENQVRQVAHPDAREEGTDEFGRVLYYWKKIEGLRGSVLKVTINPDVSPRRVVTLHPDRGMRRQMEREGKL